MSEAYHSYKHQLSRFLINVAGEYLEQEQMFLLQREVNQFFNRYVFVTSSLN